MESQVSSQRQRLRRMERPPLMLMIQLLTLRTARMSVQRQRRIKVKQSRITSHLNVMRTIIPMLTKTVSPQQR